MKTDKTIRQDAEESYVINILARDESDTDSLVGTIKSLGSNELKSFNTVEELLGFIMQSAGATDEKKCAKRSKSGAGKHAGIKEDISC